MCHVDPVRLMERNLDKDSFNEKVLRLLENSSNAGDSTNEMGTRLIGHVPQIAPKAYMHVVYAPLTEAQLLEFRGRLGRPVPHEYGEFLTHANGLSLFVGEMRVLGYVPITRHDSRSVYNYPSSVMIPNVSARIGGLSHGAVVVGWYKADGSYVAIEESGTVIRLESKVRVSGVQTWTSFDSWITSEIRAMTSRELRH